MIIAVLAVALVLAPVLTGGRLRGYADLRLRQAWVVGVAFLTQALVLGVFPTGSRPVLAALHVATYGAAAWFVWVNREVPGLWLLGLGTISNGLTIALNGGTLPASASALRTAGLTLPTGTFVNSGTVPDPVLPWLGDVFAIPASWPMANVFSIGDVLILAGLGWGAHRICGSRVTGGPEAWRHRPTGPASTADQRLRPSTTTATTPPSSAPRPASTEAR